MIAAAFLTSAMTVDKSLKIGDKAPKIETIEGINVVNDANSAGKTKVISFWNPKDPSSRIMNKNLSREYEETIGDKVDFISICTDNDEKLMQSVMQIDGVDSRNSYSYSEVSPRVFKDYGVENQTKAFVISPEGKIVEIF